MTEAAGATSGSASVHKLMAVVIGALWLAFQLYILFHPLEPLIAHPLHLVFALALVLVWRPLGDSAIARGIDGACLLAVGAVGVYYWIAAERLASRIDGVDPVLPRDVVCGVLLIALLLEAVRRIIVGWSLLGVLLAALVYALIGPLLPGALGFSGFSSIELLEILTMTPHGVLGVTTETSVQFVFYFVLFGAVYAAIGGGQLMIDIALRVTGGRHGGAAKAAVCASSLMGSISGSAVANVSATGVFTIPLMRRTGYEKHRAGAIEAIASTGGQLMPPIMGVAAFVMAEILQVEYSQVALAGLLPALAFYLGLFVTVDLQARRDGLGVAAKDTPAIAPRLHLLVPPLLLIVLLLLGYSTAYCATFATAASIIICYLRPATRLHRAEWLRALEETTRQGALIAAPIASIGIIIAIAVQSNLALKFSSQLIGQSGDNLLQALGMIALGCLLMGAGLPTVAAYIIGAVLFAPALIELGVDKLAAHLFVMYYCVLSMVTPPVALASYAAAGIADADTMPTSMEAFRLSFVCFLIPLAFVFDPRLLAQESMFGALFPFISVCAGTAGWSLALVGWAGMRLAWPHRIGLAALSVAAIVLSVTTTLGILALGLLILCLGYLTVGSRLAPGRIASTR